MRFTTRDMLWLTALVAMGLSWWLDVRRRDGAVESAQYRKDYYSLMADLAQGELKQAREASAANHKRLSEALQRERDRADQLEKAAKLEADVSP